MKDPWKLPCPIKSPSKPMARESRKERKRAIRTPIRDHWFALQANEHYEIVWVTIPGMVQLGLGYWTSTTWWTTSWRGRIHSTTDSATTKCWECSGQARTSWAPWWEWSTNCSLSNQTFCSWSGNSRDRRRLTSRQSLTSTSLMDTFIRYGHQYMPPRRSTPFPKP